MLEIIERTTHQLQITGEIINHCDNMWTHLLCHDSDTVYWRFSVEHKQFWDSTHPLDMELRVYRYKIFRHTRLKFPYNSTSKVFTTSFDIYMHDQRSTLDFRGIFNSNGNAGMMLLSKDKPHWVYVAIGVCIVLYILIITVFLSIIFVEPLNFRL